MVKFVTMREGEGEGKKPKVWRIGGKTNISPLEIVEIPSPYSIPPSHSPHQWQLSHSTEDIV